MFFNDAIFADSFYVMFGNCKIDYFLVGSGNLCIDADGDSIKNSTECIDATKKVGKFFDGLQNDANNPIGCYEYCKNTENCGGNVYFNSYNVLHSRTVHGNPICRRKGKILREYEKFCEKYSKMKIDCSYH